MTGRHVWSGGRDRSTCLGSVDVAPNVTVDAGGWPASAAFASRLNDDEREGWSFLTAVWRSDVPDARPPGSSRPVNHWDSREIDSTSNLRPARRSGKVRIFSFPH